MSLYLEHFGLSEPPFRITPHTDFFFEGADRGATLEALIYAVLHDEGIVKVSGEVGSGKTMLCRVLMERLPTHVDTIYLATPSLGRDDILHAIADDLQLRLPTERASLALRALQEHLIERYAQGRRVVVLIDEAHAMPEETLEQVRLLSNLESNRHKLLQIVLFGQPELDVALAKSSLRQLRDRITHSFRTRSLSLDEVSGYLSFRLRAAGSRGPDLFSPSAARILARASGGLTRRINVLADKALLAAFAANRHAVTARHARIAVRDSEFAAVARRNPIRFLLPATLAALAAGVAMGLAVKPAWMGQQPAVPDAIEKASAEPAAVSRAAPAEAAPVAASIPDRVAPAMPAAVEHLDARQLRAIDGYSAAGHDLLSERLAATKTLLRAGADDRFSIELFSTDNSDPARMERFLRRAQELVPLEELFVIPAPRPGGFRLHVVFGDFATREEAQRAARRLPPKYQRAFDTAAVSLAGLRSQIR